jgi:osmotically-inducible protein OsmY
MESDNKTTYTLNVWAEDLADAIGMSMTNGTYSWLSNTTEPIRTNINQSLYGISKSKNMSIDVMIGNDHVFIFGNLSKENKIVSASRILTEVDGSLNLQGGVETLKVTIGI